MKNFLFIFPCLLCGFLRAQNVGIGTENPYASLHIVRNTSDLLILENNLNLNVGVNDNIYFKAGAYYTSAIKSIGTGLGQARLGFFTNADYNANYLEERLSILYNGNVGIGTTTPQSSLDVTAANRRLFEINNTQPLSNGAASDFNFRIGGWYTNSIRSVGNSGSDARLGFFTGVSNDPTSQSETMSVSKVGVGIGVTSPVSPLHIKMAKPTTGHAHFLLENTGSEAATIDLRNNIPGLWNISALTADAPGNSTFSFYFANLQADHTVMQLNGNGNVGIGATTPLAPLHIFSNSSIATPQLLLEESENEYARIKMKNSSGTFWDIAGKAATVTTDAYLNLYLYNGSVGADKFSLRGNGNLWIAGALTQNSDARLKKDIAVIENSLEKLEQINGYHYNWKDADRDPALQTGVLAQELEKVMPELVSSNAEGTKSVNYSGLIPYLLEAIKTLQKEVDALKIKR